jgi:hypothetical protein
LHANDGILSNQDLTSANYAAVNEFSSLNESFTLDGLLTFEHYTLDQNQYVPDVSMALYETPELQSESWCAWMHQDLSLSVMAENPVRKPNSNLLAVLQMERPYAQHSADLVIQSLRSFPTMMQRRETFPWFIHPQSQLLSKSEEALLPEALSTCMSIAQMFTSRTPETNHFIWQTVKIERCRFIDEVRALLTSGLLMLTTKKMNQMSNAELLAAVQACMIYLIMCIIDPSPEDEANGLELLVALQASPRCSSWISLADLYSNSPSYLKAEDLAIRAN